MIVNFPRQIKERVRRWNRRRLMRRRAKRGMRSRPAHLQRNIIDLAALPHVSPAHGSIGVHVHIFYGDLIPFFAKYLRNIPNPYDLYVSCPEGDLKRKVERAFRGAGNCASVTVRQVPNRGRDVAPMLCEFADQLRKHTFIAHLHSKKSLYNDGATTGWLEYHCEGLLGSAENIAKILSLLSGPKPYGIVYPLNYHALPPQANTWLANKGRAREWAQRLGLQFFPETYFDYPAGTMFWARAEALHPLLSYPFAHSDFDEEAGQTDGTLAHAIERLVSVTVKSAGFPIGVLQDPARPAWSPWRLDGYFERRADWLDNLVQDKSITLVAFDIFDTLLCRPLLDPEMTKELVAHLVGEPLGTTYLQFRAQAESLARARAGRDIGLQQTYAVFEELAGVSAEICSQLRRTEEHVEATSLSARPDGIAILRAAQQAGKDIVLISDMFLSHDFIATALQRHGVTGWRKLYVSSEVGVRKDSGLLYRRVLADLGLQPKEVLMVGDSERSDWQIPNDMGMRTFHLLRATDTARANIRFMPILEEVEGCRDINDHLTLGLVVQREFSPIFYQSFDPRNLFPCSPYDVGFSVLGPLVAAFSEWLARETASEAGATLFFLAREGQALKIAYDRWVAGTTDAPKSEYLILSRRAVNVAAISSFDDILRIARSDFFPNSLNIFLTERYGLQLTELEWECVRRETGWYPTRALEIRDRDVSHIEPLLRALQPAIMQRAQAERPPLLSYLKHIGLLDCPRAVVVDVGYSGTIQGSLNRLLGGSVFGRYMATDQAANQIHPLGQNNAQGCFANAATRDETAPLVLRQSFLLEKLLSSDDAQLLHYEQDGEHVRPIFRALTSAELATRGPRAEIRAGMLAFLDEALKLKTQLYPSFQPSAKVATALYDAYVAAPSPQEAQLSAKLALDDYYCGRGIVQ